MSLMIFPRHIKFENIVHIVKAHYKFNARQNNYSSRNKMTNTTVKKVMFCIECDINNDELQILYIEFYCNLHPQV